VGVHQDHRSASRSSDATIGDSTSSTISGTTLEPAEHVVGVVVTGTSFATGRPFFVMSTITRFVRTSSMIQSPVP
jgi:hypothetical protein